MSRLLFIRYKKTAGNILEGGEQCSQRNMNVLQTLLGTDNVDVRYIHDENRKRHLCDYIAGTMGFLHHRFFGLTRSCMRSIVHQALSGYDYVFIDRSVFGILAQALKHEGYKGKVICFFHNVEDVYFDCKLPRRLPFRNVVIRCAAANDHAACRHADSIIALNARDADELFRRHSRKADALAPIAFRDKYVRDEYPTDVTSPSPLCLCIGSYFPPNCEGIEWFCREVLPHVAINLKVVGKGMGRLRDNYAIPDNVEVVADAPDLTPYFEEADVMVLPIFKGSGMKVKTCECLMYGKNIIGTTEAFEGYDLDFSHVGACCQSKEEFIRALRDVIAQPRPRFNAYSRQAFLNKYSEEVITSQFARLLSAR